jgi:hypothetical protein
MFGDGFSCDLPSRTVMGNQPGAAPSFGRASWRQVEEGRTTAADLPDGHEDLRASLKAFAARPVAIRDQDA